MPSAISRFMPRFRLRQVDRVAVAASPEEAWAHVRNLDLYRVPFVRALFTGRLLPEHIVAWFGGSDVEALPHSMRPDDIVARGSGFCLLSEVPGREFTVGAVGKFWEPSIPFVTITPDTFVTFDEPGFGKLAWSLQVHPRAGGGSWIAVELRVGADDDATWRRFTPYWALIGPFSHAIRKRTLQMCATDLGEPEDDVRRALPSDAILSVAESARTDAITIEAPPASVWPWLVQMGCRRAGWYSIDALDNGGVKSARRIVPELQHVAVGDLWPATPNDLAGFAVLRVEPERLLVLGSPNLLPDRDGEPAWGMLGARYDTTWAFSLEPIGDDATRLVVRVRARFENGAAPLLARALLPAIHAIMEGAQLENLKRRAEQAPPVPPRPPMASAGATR